jgi:hypothetical protein
MGAELMSGDWYCASGLLYARHSALLHGLVSNQRGGITSSGPVTKGHKKDACHVAYGSTQASLMYGAIGVGLKMIFATS